MRWARAAAFATAMMVGAGAMSGLAGCSTDDSPQATPPEHAAATIGAHGGIVKTPNGSGVYIPTGALAASIAVTVDATPNAPKPSGGTAVSAPYTFGPEGQEFSLPVTVTLAFDSSKFPAGRTANDIVIYTAPVGTTQFVPLATSLIDSTHAAALTMHFSVFVCVIPDVVLAQDAGSDGGSVTDAGHDATPGDGGPDATLGDSGDDGGEAGPTGYDSDSAAEPPPAPDAATTGATTPHAFVLHAIHLGDEKDPVSGKPDWYEIGYDIDGKTTTAASTDVCTPAQNTSLKSMADGTNGIDNSFGANLVPTLAAIAVNPSPTETAAIMNGTYTLMIDLKGLDEANLAQTATGLTGQLFGAVPFNQGPNAQGAVPTFTTSDDWPLDPAFVTTSIADGGALATPVVSTEVFSRAYIANGTFVGYADEVSITVLLGGAPMVLPVRHAVITFTNGGTHAASGVLAGVILTTDLVKAFEAVAGNINTSFCPGSATFQTLQTTIEQSADIMHDGSNAAGTPCDAVSIGIGFTADEIGLPQVAGVPATTIDVCALPDAGDGG